MAIFWQIAAHSVYLMFSLYSYFFNLVISYFGFEGGTIGIINSAKCFPNFIKGTLN